MPAPLEHRFLENLRALGVGDAPARLLVGVSGGCDSMVLLHLLRFSARGLPLTITAAHLDHAMRADSAADARWLAGVCAAWGLPLRSRRLEVAPHGEDAARQARYAFFRDTARDVGATIVLTAHHADDQAETVLFRVLRGTGLRGLQGIPARSGTGLLRPLLPFWREELEGFAREAGLRWRSDSTNLDVGPARNRIRLELLPLIERGIAPGARRSLVALADLAREAEAGQDDISGLLEGSVARLTDGGAVLARSTLRDYDSGLGARILRKILRSFGVVLGREGTRTALQFITDAPSGRELHLPGGLRIRLEFDAARIERDRAVPPDEPLDLSAPGPDGEGQGRLLVGGRPYDVEWRAAERATGESDSGGLWRVALDLASLDFPLRLRGWRPGDRMRTPGGTKTLKKLFLERRVSRGDRARRPVLADSRGGVLWVGGIGLAEPLTPRPDRNILILSLSNARLDEDPGPDGGA